ncbi:MAG: HDOD domain-containing protein [Burkholderiaceae bacterium]|jgi:HD-like signal output (HDOD) protein|nr:HDOD domain-containing protein [Burkholderiaceae bacterium]
MCSAPPPPITRALPDLQAWTAHFLAAPVPVLADTAELLEAYRANEDAVDAHLLAETVSADPLMSLKLMAHVAGARSQRSTTDPETVTAALVMLGISPFFRAFGPQTTVDEYLGGNAAALQGLGEVLRRANRGAAFALAFAVHRMDHDAQVIHAAAQLHDFAEMLLWLHAPALALRMAERQQQDPALRSAAIQRELLHVELHDLQQALMRAWHLPELLVRINDERHADPAQVRNVQLAVRLARHTARGWDNAALPDDVRDIAALLNLGETPTLHLLRDIDA